MASRRKTSRQLYAEPKIYDAAFSWDSTVETEFYSRLLDEYAALDSKSRLVEFACGTGRVLRMLSRRESFLVGLDISPAMVSFAQRKSTGNRDGFIVADMVSVPAKPESFDAALCTLSSINYLSSITSVEEHLREASRILTDDGIYIIDFLLGIPVKTGRNGRRFAAEPAMGSVGASKPTPEGLTNSEKTYPSAQMEGRLFGPPLQSP